MKTLLQKNFLLPGEIPLAVLAFRYRLSSFPLATTACIVYPPLTRVMLAKGNFLECLTPAGTAPPPSPTAVARSNCSPPSPTTVL